MVPTVLCDVEAVFKQFAAKIAILRPPAGVRSIVLRVKEDVEDEHDTKLHDMLFTLAGALEDTDVKLEVSLPPFCDERPAFRSRFWTLDGCRALSTMLIRLEVHMRTLLPCRQLQLPPVGLHSMEWQVAVADVPLSSPKLRRAE